MSKQIVISGTRVLAHGEDCFAVTGNTVVCTNSDKVYDNATIATVEEIPVDIDTVGYEYHAGVFVPCAPYGIGSGNIAVVCGNDCKALKDSGIPLERFAKYASTSYVGTGKTSYTITFDGDFTPSAMLIVAQYANGSSDEAYSGFFVGSRGVSLPGGTTSDVTEILKVTYGTGTATITAMDSTQSAQECLCQSGTTYGVILLG